MSRVPAVLTAVVMVASFSGCQFIPGFGGGGAPLPTEVPNTLFTGDPANLKEGRWMTNASEASGYKSTTTVKCVGKDGGNSWVEWWTEAGGNATGYLFVVGGDKKITKAWAAHKDDKDWKETKVTEPPKGQAGDQPKPEIKESEEKKEVKGGSFASHKMDVTMTISGTKYNSQSWYSKDVWKLHSGSDHGGLVAVESANMKMWLDGKGEDGKASIELPKK